MTEARKYSGTVVRDGDTDYRTVHCRTCRAPIIVLFHRGDTLVADIHAPVLDPERRLPIEPFEFLPADDETPEWSSAYAGMTRPSTDPRGVWFGGIDVAEEIDGDPYVEITCYCRGARKVDLGKIAAEARVCRASRMWWPVG